MTESAIKATKPIPARIFCTYHEAIFRMAKAYQEGSEVVREGVSFALAFLYERDKATVQADLERGHV